MSDPTTCADSCNAISLPVLESGPQRSDLPAGQTATPFGRDLALANLSARQARELGLLTSGTYGPPGSASLGSANLQSSLESRLRARTQVRGSTLYKLTWRAWTTPSGVCRFRLRASTRRKTESALTGWPTPRASDGLKNVRTRAGALREVARKGCPQDLAQAALLSIGYGGLMAESDRLNPALARWLMGIPAIWDACAPTETA